MLLALLLGLALGIGFLLFTGQLGKKKDEELDEGDGQHEDPAEGDEGDEGDEGAEGFYYGAAYRPVRHFARAYYPFRTGYWHPYRRPFYRYQSYRYPYYRNRFGVLPFPRRRRYFW